jgi:methylated-DNA-[protein]-cysteine S-methyltransferase
MKRKPQPCLDIERDLIAVATQETGVDAAPRVEAHTRACPPCAREFQRYRALGQAVEAWRGGSVPADAVARARQRIETGLGDLRRRLLIGRVFESPLGPLLIARSEEGVSLIEYLDDAHGALRSRLAVQAGLELIEDGAEIEALYRELLEYLEGARTRLDWPLDLRLARSDFQREVLRATAAVPYGAVTSYLGIAGEIGQPNTVRAVAQALRHNPLPIVVPCHRIVGASGDLTGYAGSRLGLKERLLGVEGVRTEHAPTTPRVARQSLYHYDRNDERQYCLPTCGSIAHRPIGRVTLLASRERATALGLVPCTDCRPDLHPLLQ